MFLPFPKQILNVGTKDLVPEPPIMPSITPRFPVNARIPPSHKLSLMDVSQHVVVDEVIPPLLLLLLLLAPPQLSVVVVVAAGAE